MFRFICLMFALAAFPAYANVEGWVGQFKQEAAAQGISSPLLAEALDGFEPNATVIRLDRKQPEGVMSLGKYLHNVVPASRIARARNEYTANRSAIDSAASRYGVSPEAIVALWGIESNFGENQGSFDVVEALATLAYEGRRASYFRKELINALKIIDAGHIRLQDMKGSWAGAMGQCQFMPSSFLAYAADGDGDGRKDIWNTESDVFVSIAHYLSTVGWDATLPIIVKVDAAKTFDFKGHVGNHWRSVASWKRLGVEVESSTLAEDASVKLVRIGKGQGAYYALATRNFDTLMDWNRSTYFAAAVSKLSGAIKE
jgi:membrane-bound lytic murein transglycosylase B